MFATTVCRPAILLSIRGYQKFLSPYKGYRCAHHYLHGKGSCSAYGYEVFSCHPITVAMDMLKERFKECRMAAVTVRAKRKKQNAKKKKEDDCDSFLYGCIGGWCGSSIGSSSGSAGSSAPNDNDFTGGGGDFGGGGAGDAFSDTISGIVDGAGDAVSGAADGCDVGGCGCDSN
jgi:putative component of membrane protein insertase Oxa1/YidC/SpoIIIJ protein YidD